MRCGTKCSLVEFESKTGKKERVPIISRTPAEARKTLRHTYGKDVHIYTVKLDNRK